jgi:peptidoglycan/xylan/chitin deacetylase (PgdA/CDA1 family)
MSAVKRRVQMNNNSDQLNRDQYLKFSSIGALFSIIFSLVPSGNYLAYGQNEDGHDTTISECRCVAFRLDDIQDYWLNNVQVGVIDTFRKNDASLTVGVIGNYFGEDQKLVSYLKSRLSNDSEVRQASIEIANHGWNHEDFTLFTETQQSELLAKGNQKIVTLLGVEPTVFIPPLNRVDNDTILALLENNMQYISANITDSPALSQSNVNKSLVVYHFPSQVATGDLNADDTEWQGFTHKDTLDGIDNSIQKYGYSVVTLHPQEYSFRDQLNFQNVIDKGQISELVSVIKEVQNKGIPIVTISQISKYVMTPEYTNTLLYLAVSVPLSTIVLYHKLYQKLRPHNSLFIIK